MSNDAPDSDNTQYNASWEKPGSPGHDCSVSANEYGVSYGEKWGPTPYSEWGKSYTWAEWFDHGSAGPDGPVDMVARINAVGRKLGHEPAARPTTRRADLVLSDNESLQGNAQYLADLQIQSRHSSLETLRLSAKKFRSLRARVLRQAEGLWAALRPGVKVSSRPDEVTTDGVRTLRRSVFVQPSGDRAYAIVQSELVFQSGGQTHRWYELRAQCVRSACSTWVHSLGFGLLMANASLR